MAALIPFDCRYCGDQHLASLSCATQAEGRALDDYSEEEEEDQLPSYRPVYTSNKVILFTPNAMLTTTTMCPQKVDDPPAATFKPSNLPTPQPPPVQVAPVYHSPVPTLDPLDPSAPLPLPPNPPPPPPPQQNLATPPPQLLSSNPLTRLKQGLRAQIESVPQKLFNVATRKPQEPKKNVPKNYNTLGLGTPPYQPQQSNLAELGNLIENVKIPTVYGPISPRLPSLPDLPKPPSLQNFLYGNQVLPTFGPLPNFSAQGYAPPPADPVHPIYPTYPHPAQDPYARCPHDDQLKIVLIQNRTKFQLWSGGCQTTLSIPTATGIIWGMINDH